jgi:hypothetical protein
MSIPWIIDGVRRDGKRFQLCISPLVAPSDEQSVEMLRDLLLIENCFEATFVSPSSRWFCMHRGYLYDLDRDPADFFPQPEWPFNEFRKEKL